MTAQRAALPVTGGRADTHEGAAAKDAHGADLLDGLRREQSGAARMTPTSDLSASDRNAARAKAENWSGRGASGDQHTPRQ
jgi:hypothetical protein